MATNYLEKLQWVEKIDSQGPIEKMAQALENNPTTQTNFAQQVTQTPVAERAKQLKQSQSQL